MRVTGGAGPVVWITTWAGKPLTTVVSRSSEEHLDRTWTAIRARPAESSFLPKSNVPTFI